LENLADNMGTEHFPSSCLILTSIILEVRLAYDFYLELHVKSESLSKRPVSIHKHHIFDSNLIILQIELHIIAAESGVYLVCQTF